MRGFKLFIILLIVGLSSCTQQTTGVKRPKLVVGLVVDQMRWDYLYRYSDHYGNDGFKRLLRDGFSCEHTMINYLPTFTAPGHACIYTGSVPSIHGIAGNNWIDNLSGEEVYCVEDSNVHGVGGGDLKYGAMSPRILLTTTITDELRLATNMKSRVYGVAIKDRSSILPAGHLGNGAYWYDDSTGDFRSSSYYHDASPKWLQAFNQRHLADSLVSKNWTLLYDISTYDQSLTDTNKYEKCFKCENQPVFPHITEALKGRSKYSICKSMPAGNTITMQLAKACMEGAQLAKADNTDFLCISLSSTDYTGHQFGPNSIEIEDMYLRLDQEIADFLKYLDKNIGKGNYLFFLTADHGAAHNPGFLHDEDVPSGILNSSIMTDLNVFLKARFGKDSLAKGIRFINYQFTLNEPMLEKARVNKEQVKAAMIDFLNKRPEIAYAVDLEHINNSALPEPLRTMIVNGYNRTRCGVIQVILNPGWYESEGGITGTTHGSWNPYDTHIPLLWYGWHVPKGKTYNQLNMTDISATLAAILHIQMPSGCIGKPILEITEKIQPCNRE